MRGRFAVRTCHVGAGSGTGSWSSPRPGRRRRTAAPLSCTPPTSTSSTAGKADFDRGGDRRRWSRAHHESGQLRRMSLAASDRGEQPGGESPGGVRQEDGQFGAVVPFQLTVRSVRRDSYGTPTAARTAACIPSLRSLAVASERTSDAAVANKNVIFRIPTPVFGAGLIEQIPDSAILANLTANGTSEAVRSESAGA